MEVHNDRGMSRSRRRRNSEAALGELIDARLSRRGLLRGLLGATTAAVTLGVTGHLSGAEYRGIALRRTAREVMPAGYVSQLIIAAGDPLLPGAPDYTPFHADPAAAAMQFGVNNDFIALLPLTLGGPGRPDGSRDLDGLGGLDGEFDPTRALLFANHEYPNPELLWPDLNDATAGRDMSLEQVATTMAMVGASVCELHMSDGRWELVRNSHFNRRITATTPIRLSGPAAGDAALCTREDPQGRLVKGTLSNCNGGVTPWGTVLTCEEGAGWLFAGNSDSTSNADALRRYYYDEEDNDRHGWSRIEPRFNLQHEVNEPNRFEWVVEIDPYDPASMPVKRTALGRFAHEGAHTAVAPDGRVVVYLGDDWEFEYCYRFVTEHPWNPENRTANRNLLDSGVLSVARFHDDGTLEWVPLIFGEGPLTPENGFASQADVLIRTRAAADLLDATPMDSPEGFQPHPHNGCVYLALTSNSDREAPGPANPRANNRFGHVLELRPPATDHGHDHAADRFQWEVLVLCGDPNNAGHGASFHANTDPNGWFTDPDNLGFDPSGRMWICTDGVQPTGHDGLYVMPVTGPDRARPQLFYAPPAGGECCSPQFNADATTLFLAIQHPGEGVATLAQVPTHWPAEDESAPPRAGVVAITRIDGGKIAEEFGR